MSHDDDKVHMERMKQNLSKNVNSGIGGGGMGGDGMAFGNKVKQSSMSSGSIYERVCDIVENIDELSDRAHNMKLTRSEFLNCLRECTQIKILSIKEAKQIFQKRVHKLLKAQQYELKSQENFGINAAHHVFKDKGKEVK